MKYRNWLLGVICTSILALSGCGDSNAKQLVGSWKMDAGLGTMTMTFSSDGTWVQTAAGMIGGSGSGVWKVDRDTLTTTTKSSTLDKASVGKDDTSQIITLNDSVLVLKGGRNGEQMITLQRVK